MKSTAGFPIIVAICGPPSQSAGMTYSSTPIGSMVRSRDEPLNQRRVSGNAKLAFHSGEIVQAAEGAKRIAQDCGGTSRMRRWPLALIPKDHTVSDELLPEAGTRLKAPSKLNLSSNPKFRSCRVAKL